MSLWQWVAYPVFFAAGFGMGRVEKRVPLTRNRYLGRSRDHAESVPSLSESLKITGDKSHSPTKVIVLTPAIGGSGGIARMMDGVAEELARTPRGDVQVTFVSTRGKRGAIAPLVFLVAVIRVAFACAVGRCDILHINLASYGSTYRKLILAAIARATGTPYVIHLHGGKYEEFWASVPSLVRRGINAMFRHAGQVVVLGRMGQKLVLEHVPDVVDRILVLPNATRRIERLPERAPQGRAEPLIVFLGRLYAVKGIPTLLDALSGLAAEPGWNAVLAGDGEVNETRQRVAAKGLEKRVAVTGWLSPDEVDALWRKAAILVLPSVTENMPLAILEAFAYGVPVVATPVGSVPELIEDGRTGLLVPVGDTDALGEALRRLIHDPVLRNAIAAAASTEFLQRFEIGAYVDRLAAMWASGSGAPSMVASSRLAKT